MAYQTGGFFAATVGVWEGCEMDISCESYVTKVSTVIPHSISHSISQKPLWGVNGHIVMASLLLKILLLLYALQRGEDGLEKRGEIGNTRLLSCFS